MRLSPSRAALATALVLAPILLAPAIFGNMPLAMVDEEVFVRTALAALAQHTLPGFADAGAGFQAPYGAVLTYALYLVLAPLYVLASFATGAERDAGLLLAARAGDIIQIARWIDGAALLAFFATLAYAAAAEVRLRRSFVLLALLLLGNTLLLSLAHTGKMWLLQTLFELCAGTLVIAREALGSASRVRLLTEWYLPALILCTLLAVSQSFMGALAALWIAYAVFLGHVSLRQAGVMLIRFVPLGMLFALLQYSFIMSGWHISRDAAAGFTHVTGAGVAPLSERVFPPLISTLAIAPAAVLAWLVSLAAGLATADRRRLAVALVHPLVIYCVYFLIAGFGTSLRYLGPLTAALALASGLLTLGQPRVGHVLVALALPFALFSSIFVGWLWWQPSSETAIRDLLFAPGVYAARGTTLYIEAPQLFPLARLSDFNNEATLRSALSHEGADRAVYQVAWRDIVLSRAFMDSGRTSAARFVSVLDRTLPASRDARSFQVTDDCHLRCREDELARGTCVAINAALCDGSDEHGNLLSFPDLLRVSQLGHAYFVRAL